MIGTGLNVVYCRHLLGHVYKNIYYHEYDRDNAEFSRMCILCGDLQGGHFDILPTGKYANLRTKRVYL